jgi:rRNA maturation endonuclease Nob1
MGLVGSITETLKASTESANRGGDTGDSSKGAYWCHDCAERIRDVDVEGENSPDCPDCGAAMEFKRSPSSTGCAC